jgi:hypothetical protein
VYFVRRELLSHRSHLHINVILANTLCKGCELPFDIGGMLSLKRWSSDFETTGAVTGGARRDAASRIAGKYQTGRRIASSQAATRHGNAIPI